MTQEEFEAVKSELTGLFRKSDLRHLGNSVPTVNTMGNQVRDVSVMSTRLSVTQ